MAILFTLLVFSTSISSFVNSVTATDAVAPETVPAVPEYFLDDAAHLDRFLNDNPNYQLGRLEETALTPDELTKVYERLGHATSDCETQEFKRSDDEYLRQQTDPSYSRLTRSQMEDLVWNLRNPDNYVDGHYAGPFSGYTAGEHWGLKLMNTPGAPGLQLCVEGWMRSGEVTKSVSGNVRKPLE